jgi:ABC-type phosphate transport system substrate-binding protein
MVQNKKLSPRQVGWICAFVAASTPLTTSVLSAAVGLRDGQQAIASTGIGSKLLASVPADLEALAKSAKVRISSSNSMLSMNDALKKQFTAKYSGGSVDVTQANAKKALEEVLAGKSDLAAIGRALTPEEKAQGLVATLVGRDKIAVVVNPENAFKKDLTIPKFAQIFRGEITDWSQLGGKGKISFVDRTNSDTRQALAGYPAFKNAPLASGKEAIKLDDTSMKGLVANLKGAGVSFVPANQARTQPGLRTLTMHGVLPTDSRYPFSQPLYYVYKSTGGSGGGMNNNAKAFLGFLSTEDGQSAARQSGIAQIQKPGPDRADVKIAKAEAKSEAKPGSEKVSGTGTEVRPNGAPSGIAGKAGSGKISASNNTIAAEDGNGLFGLPVPGWLKWLLPLGLLGTGLLLLLLPNKRDQDARSFAADDRERADFNPLAGADDAVGNAARNTTEIIGGATNAGGAALAGGAAAIGGLAAGAAAKLRGNGEDNWTENDGAPYIRDETDLNVVDRARDAAGNAVDGTTRILGDVAGAGGAAAAGAAAGAAGLGTAAWGFLKGKGNDVKDAALDARDAASNTLNAKIEVPNITAPTADGASDLSVDQNWSFDDADKPESSGSGFFDRLKGGAANLAGNVKDAGAGVAAVGLGAAAATGAAIGGTADAARTRLVGDRASIVIVPQNAREAVVRWQVSEAQKRDAKQQGGQDLALRLYDVTGIDPNSEVLENFYQYDCNELTQELRIEVPVPARDYVVEVGYVDRSSEWYGIARSLPVHITAA